ncbi:MAG: efflux RND transporter permease subunit [Pseudomonadota bacterium]
MLLGHRVRAAGEGVFAYFARHGTAANLLMVLMIASGIVAAFLIRSQFFPDVVANKIEVNVDWRGAGPEDVDQGIVALLEPALLTVGGVESTEATATMGKAEIELTFEPGWDMSRAQADVETAVAGVDSLPETAEDPRISRRQWNDRVTDVIIWGPLPVAQLGLYADEYMARLYQAGITRTRLQGVTAPVIEVSVPEAQLIRHDLTLREISDLVGDAARGSPAGEVNADASRVRAGEDLRDPEAIGALPVRSAADVEDLRLRDIAEIADRGSGSGRAYFRDGQPAVSIRVNRHAQGDAIAIQETVVEVTEEFRQTLPAGAQIELVRTRAEGITQRLDLLMRNGMLGLALVVGLLFLFLNARTALWVAAGIPVAMFAALALMYGAGITLNMISLFGLILCLGLVVDDAIVVAEHADWRYRHLGEAPASAAENAARRMAVPVFCAMLTTVIAFFGLTSIGGRFGALVGDIPFTVIVVLTASLMECFLILPHHMAGALARGGMSWLDAPSRFVNRGLSAFRARIFRPFITWVVRLRYPVIAACLLLLAQSAAMFIKGDVVWRFWAPPEQGSVTGNFAMLPGTSRAETIEMLRELERAAAAVDARFAEEYGRAPVVSLVSQVGGTAGRGLPGDEEKDADVLGAIEIELIDPDFRPYSGTLFLQAMEEEARRPPKLEVLSFRRFGSSSGDDELEVSFFGADARALKAASEAFKAALVPFGAVTGLEDTLSFDKTELILELTPLGERLGFSIDAVGAELFARLSGIEVAEFAVGPRTATIEVRLPEEEVNADFLSRTRMRAADGTHVSLGQIVTVESRLGFSGVRRENGLRVVTVTGGLDESDPAYAAEVTREIETEILPDISERFGVSYSLGGLSEDERNFLSDSLVGFVLCLIGIYLTLAWVFESWVRPLVVLAIIPFGFIGTVWGHYQWDLALSIFTVIGLIGMTGIIINNAIVLVTTIDTYGRRLPTVASVVEAASDRFRPILLTTLTTLLGLAPLLFERSSQALFLKPTVVSLVYGLGLGGILVLILVPALVVVERDIRLALRAWRRIFRVGGKRPGLSASVALTSVAALIWFGIAMAPALFGSVGPGAYLQVIWPDMSDGWSMLLALAAGLALILLPAWAAIRATAPRSP